LVSHSHSANVLLKLTVGIQDCTLNVKPHEKNSGRTCRYFVQSLVTSIVAYISS